jgi:hypothetical protein
MTRNHRGRVHPSSVRPIYQRGGLAAKRPEPKNYLPEQRHWLKFFVIGLFFITYGSFEFLAGKPETPNVFNAPEFAAYWVMIGIPVIFLGFVVRTWGSR